MVKQRRGGGVLLSAVLVCQQKTQTHVTVSAKDHLFLVKKSPSVATFDTIVNRKYLSMFICGYSLLVVVTLAVTAFGKETFDKSLYKIVWNDEPATESVLKGHDINVDDDTSMWINTRHNESYFCKLPSISGSDSDVSSNTEDSSPLSPYKLLKPLITREVCSYRLEPYWTYELCHGKMLRQFHEESSVAKVKGQEFILGKYDANDLPETEEVWKEKIKALKGKPAPTVIVDGIQLPYIEFNFTSGTLCDLNNKPRKTRVLYVCHEESKHELHSVKETFSCEYEAIILSPLLCLHKDFVIKTDTEIDINCYPLHSIKEPVQYEEIKVDTIEETNVDTILDPKEGKKQSGKPKDVLTFEEKMEADSVQPEVPFFDGKTIILNAGSDTPGSSSPKVKIELRFHDEDGNEISKETFGDLPNDKPIGVSGKVLGFDETIGGKKKLSVKKDASFDILRDFLSGTLCLQGGTGWWKYEFCYGDRVEQYHEEDGKRTSTITLGRWDEKVHTDWLKDHEDKRPQPGKTPIQVSHFYANGDVCDETDKPRQVEVKLKCKQVDGHHRESVALYLLEPKTCQYVLGIESTIICDLLSSVNSEGLMSLKSSSSVTSTEEDTVKESREEEELKDDDVDDHTEEW